MKNICGNFGCNK